MENSLKLSRFLEIGLVLSALLMLAPLFLLVFFLIRLTSPGAALFRQKRIGLGGAEFTFYKFRTMRVDSEGLLLTSRNDQRITRVGRLLRKTKIDELPQLWNVVRGDMSLIGPRPEVAAYVDLANPLWIEVLKVKPGITDPVTCRLRSEEGMLESVAYDKETFYREVLQPYKLNGYIEYLKIRTWKSDTRILIQTFFVILVPKIIHQPILGLDKSVSYLRAASK